MLIDVKKKTRKIELGKIKLDGEWGEREWLTSTMGELGQLQPIIVIEDGDVFKIGGGRHRVTSARALGWKRIEAVVFMLNESDLMTQYLAEVTLAENAHVANKLSEARAAEVVGPDQARVLSGLSKGALKARAKLLGLTAEFQTMYEKGELAQATAKELIKLPPDRQTEAWMVACQERGDGKLPSSPQVRREVRRILGQIQPQLAVPVPSFEPPGDQKQQVNTVVLADLVWNEYRDLQATMDEGDFAAVVRVVQMLQQGVGMT